MERLSGRVALITGAANGIGRASAELFAAEGAQLVLTDIQAGPLEALADGLRASGTEVLSMAHDVSSEADWKTVSAALLDRFGGLDIVVNNAGVSDNGPLLETTYDAWRRSTSVNLDGVFLGCQYGIRAMLPADGSQRTVTGAVVNISSLYGLLANPNLAGYCASKGGVRLLTKSVALEAAHNNWNIRVNSVHPAFVRTGMGELAASRAAQRSQGDGHEALAGLHPIGRIAEPREIAEVILFAASDQASYVTGVELVADGGMSAAAFTINRPVARG